MLCFGSSSSPPKQLLDQAVCELGVNDIDVSDEGVVVCASNDRTVRAWSIDGKIEAWVSANSAQAPRLYEINATSPIGWSPHGLRDEREDQRQGRCQWEH